jgi:transmembrane sensor
MDDHGTTVMPDVDVGIFSDAWQRRQWVVDNQSLPEVLDQLARHRPGRILFDRVRMAQFKVSGVLPLDDTDRALQLLVNSFPELHVRTFTPYLVRVDAPNQP